MKSTLVKIFLILNLLLCAVVVGVSYKTFTDREIIKARTVIHRENINDIAENLDWGEAVNWEEPEETKTGAFQLPDPQTMDEMSSFTEQLGELAWLAEKRVDQLSQQYTELTENQEELQETRSTLDDRVAELATTRSRVSSLENSLSDGKQSLRDNKSELASLERETSALQQQLDELDQQITNQQTLISEVSQELELRTGERDRVEELLAACLRPNQQGNGEKTEWHQKTAQILAVEPEWNYVVINKGEVDVLPMFLEAFVHRGDELVAKIRVMQVENMVAIAEIIEDSVAPGMTVEAGDTIFF